MMIKKFRLFFIKFTTIITIAFLCISKPAISLNYEKYETWLEDFFINKFEEKNNITFIKKIIKFGKLDRDEFHKIDKLTSMIYNRDFINPEKYFDKNILTIRSKKALKLKKTYNNDLNKIENKFGIPKSIILSIWAVESDFGNAKLEFSTLKAIIFHIYKGKRVKFYINELKFLLKIIKMNKLNFNILGSSYGAMGQPQFMPSNYIKYGVDFNNDKKIDLWNNEGDTFASIANFLKLNGWRVSLKWVYEVTKTLKYPCYLEDPNIKKSLKEWQSYEINFIDKKLIKKFPSSIQTSLLLPKGEYGPKFLVTENFYILKKYNFSDFYALYVGLLANMIEGEKILQTKWTKTSKLDHNKIINIQKILIDKKFNVGGLDGLIGFKTRRSIGKNQEHLNQKITCYPG